MEDVTIYTIDNKDYIELERIEHLGKTYVYSVNDDDEEDALIQEYKSETPDEFYGISSEVYLDVLTKFKQKLEEDSKEVE